MSKLSEIIDSELSIKLNSIADEEYKSFSLTISKLQDLVDTEENAKSILIEQDVIPSETLRLHQVMLSNITNAFQARYNHDELCYLRFYYLNKHITQFIDDFYKLIPYINNI